MSVSIDQNQDRIAQEYVKIGMMTKHERGKLTYDQKLIDTISNTTGIIPDLSSIIGGYADTFKGVLFNKFKVENTMNRSKVIDSNTIITFSIGKTSNNIMNIWNPQTGEHLTKINLNTFLKPAKVFDFILVEKSKVDVNPKKVLGYGLDEKYTLVTLNCESVTIWTDLKTPKDIVVVPGDYYVDSIKVVGLNKFAVIASFDSVDIQIYDISKDEGNQLVKILSYDKKEGTLIAKDFSNMYGEYFNHDIISLPNNTVAINVNFNEVFIVELENYTVINKFIYENNEVTSPEIGIYSDTELFFNYLEYDENENRLVSKIVILDLTFGKWTYHNVENLRRYLNVSPDGSIVSTDLQNNNIVNYYEKEGDEFLLKKILDFSHDNNEDLTKEDEITVKHSTKHDAILDLKVLPDGKLLVTTKYGYMFLLE